MPSHYIQQFDLGNALAQAAAIQGARQQNALLGQQMQQRQRAGALIPGAIAGEERALDELFAVDPDLASKLDERQRKVAKENAETMGKLLFSVEQAPPDQRQAAWEGAVAQAAEWGVDVSRVPRQYDPQFSRLMLARVAQIDKMLEGPQLEEVFDPDSPTGTRLLPRREAAGKPGKPSTGFEITTGPEGTTIKTGVRQTGGGEVLSKPTQTKLEEEIRTAQAGLQRLDSIVAAFKPEYLTLPTKASMAVAAGKELLGMELTEEQKTALTEYTAFKRDSVDNLNRYIKDITGAQMSEAEADRLRKGVPDPEEDSPTQFKAKLDATVKSLRLTAARASFALRHGLGMSTVPLETMPQLIDNRGAELEAQLRRANPGLPEDQIRAQVRAQLRTEFGI